MDESREFEREQERRNPHRAEEREANRLGVVSRLRTHGVALTGAESTDDLAWLLSAAEEFERMVERRGGDTQVNTPTSSEPERLEFLLPERGRDETVSTYVDRVRRATVRLFRGR